MVSVVRRDRWIVAVFAGDVDVVKQYSSEALFFPGLPILQVTWGSGARSTELVCLGWLGGVSLVRRDTFNHYSLSGKTKYLVLTTV